MKWWHSMLVLCLIIGGVISLFASENPDGLERVAEDKGFAEEAEENRVEILPDYTIPEIESDILSAFLAGICGVLVSFVAVYMVGRVLRRKNERESSL
jgi:hypothetical protein